MFYGTRSCQTGVLPLWLYRDQSRTVFRVSSTQNGFCKYRPGEVLVDRDWEGEPFLVVTNRAGYRGAQLTDRKPGVARVALFGSGAVFGYATREEDTLSAALSREIGEGSKIEIVNLGIPRMTSSKIASQLFRELDRVNPDLVIFYGGVEDTRACLPSLWLPRCLELSRRVSAFVALTSSGRPRCSFSRSDFESQQEPLARAYLGNLEKIRSLCDKKGIPLLMVPQQMRSLGTASVDLKDTSVADEAKVVLGELDAGLVDSFRFRFLMHTGLMQHQKRWCAERGIPRVSSEALKGRRDLILGHSHLSPEGYRVLASEIKPHLLKALSGRAGDDT